MLLDLLLVNPGGSRAVYQDLAAELTAIEPNLWCRLICGYVRDRGWSAEILDAEAEGLGPDRIAARVATLAPKLVCVVAHGHQPSASTQSMTAAGEICRRIKRMLPKQPILIVGGHVAALPERTLNEEAVDFACNSEGPMTVDQLLGVMDAGRNLELVEGLVWRSRNEIIVNPAPPLIQDLDRDLHGDVWDRLPMDKYRSHNWQAFAGGERQPYASIYTSLSCPFECRFCMIDALFRASKPRQYRMRSPAAVVAEIDHLYRRYHVRTFKIVDEMFVLAPKLYVPICEGLAAKPYASELNIWAYGRIDTVKDKHLPLLRSAGIRWLALGIESGSVHVRDGADKAFDQDDIYAVVRAIQAAGINALGNFIFGLPDDTKLSMLATLDMAKQLRCEWSNFYSGMCYPGSRLYDDTPEKDRPTSWAGYSQHSFECTPTPTATLTSAEVLAFRDHAFKEYFSDPGYLTMIERKFGEAVRTHVELMAAHRLPRKLLECSPATT